MNIEELKIYETIIGSFLYGTNIESSDIDYKGIFIPPIEHYFGLQNIKQLDLSKQVKDNNNKNTKDSIDRSFHEIRKFVDLALKCSPSALELLFAPKDKIRFINIYGFLILSHRDIFISKEAKNTFVGYAVSQKHKMIIKPENYNELLYGVEFLSRFEDKYTMGQVYDYNGVILNPCFKKGTGVHIFIGDQCFEPGVYVKKAIKQLEERISKATNRTDLITKYGYDTKFGMNLIRLLYEGFSILKYKKIEFPLPEAELLVNIRNGKYEAGQILEMATKLEDDISELDLSYLPDFGNAKKAEELLLYILKDNFK